MGVEVSSALLPAAAEYLEQASAQKVLSKC